MSKVLVTQELFNNMEYDDQTQKTPATGETAATAPQPSCLIVFAKSDINAALYHLNKSLEQPFAAKAIATVLVQESIKENFLAKLKQQLKSYKAKNLAANETFTKALYTARKLNAQLIAADEEKENLYTPTLICDFTHEQLGSVGPSGIVTLHFFRTAKEAITLVNKETLKFNSVSIWHENHSYAYELIVTLKAVNYFVNCYQVPLNVLEESLKAGKNYVSFDKSYHYETVQQDGLQKCIVFPIGSIFAN